MIVLYNINQFLLTSILAILKSEIHDFGCPYCGCYVHLDENTMYSGSTAQSCNECKKVFVSLEEGCKESYISFSNYRPELVRHPRFGIKYHDFIGESNANGETFRVMYEDFNDCKCFVCNQYGLDKDGQTNLSGISALVEDKNAADRIDKMFPKGKPNKRFRDSGHCIVSIVVCPHHQANMKKLVSLTDDGIITSERVAEAMSV